jgi:hypothetical protein
MFDVIQWTRASEAEGWQPDVAFESSKFIAYFQVTFPALFTKKKSIPPDQKWPMSVHKSLSSHIKTKVSVVILF